MHEDIIKTFNNQINENNYNFSIKLQIKMTIN